MKPNELPNYWDYLELSSLLSIQGGLEEDESLLQTDELHFIVTHQALELWFKLILAEMRLARDHLSSPILPEDQVPHVVHHLKRVSEILRLATDTFRVMETLTPQDFMNFRDKLTPASGFQSFQMREIELLMGIDWSSRVKYGKVDPLDHIRKLAGKSRAGKLAVKRIDAVLKEVTLRNSLHTWLYRTPIQGSSPNLDSDEQVVSQFIAEYVCAIDAYHQEQCQLLIESSVGSVEETQKRFQAQTEAAQRYLFAHDIERQKDSSEEEHQKRKSFVCRYRAALLFIESYRELPLLAWPRLLVDALVEMESQMVKTKQNVRTRRPEC